MWTIVVSVCVLNLLCAGGRVFHTKQGHSVTIECGVNSVPKSLKWQREGALLHSITQRSGMPVKGHGSIDVAQRSRVGPNNKLEINSVKTGDAGSFTCTFDGNPFVHRLAVVTVSAQPSADLPLGSSAQLQCQVYGLTSGSVQWKTPSGQYVGSQTVALEPVKRTDTGTWECIFTIDGETKSEPLAVRVKESAPLTTTPLHPKIPEDDITTTCPTCDHSPPSLTKPWLELQWWVWVAVGAGSLVVILLIISIIVMYKRIRRRKVVVDEEWQPNETKAVLPMSASASNSCSKNAARTQEREAVSPPSATPPNTVT